MKVFKKIFLMLLANAAGLYLIAAFVPNIDIPLDFRNFALVAVVLTLINLLLRPIVKLLFMPVIILTLGLGSILVNALMLYLLDFMLPAVKIEGLLALALATLILGISNMIVRVLGKIL